MLLLLACGLSTPPANDAKTATQDSVVPGDSRSDSSDDSTKDSSSTTEDSPSLPPPPTPCFTYAAPTQTGTIVDAALEEISDVVPSALDANLLWILEDSGNPSVLTGIDPSGNTLGTLSLEGQEMVDWEDMAIGPCGTAAGSDPEASCLWIGDTGDNMVNRPSARILVVPEPTIDRASLPFTLTATAMVYDLVWPDTPHNVEALAWAPDGPVLLTKQEDGRSDVYSGSLSWLTLSKRGTLNIPVSHVTAGDLWPDSSRLLVRTNDDLAEFWLPVGGLGDLDHAIRIPVPVADEIQGESASYDPVRRGYWTLSEGVNPGIFFSSCSSDGP